MGVLGGMFPGRKLDDTGDEDGDGRLHRPRFDIDLDSGVVRMPARPGSGRAPGTGPGDGGAPDGARDADG